MLVIFLSIILMLEIFFEVGSIVDAH